MDERIGSREKDGRFEDSLLVGRRVGSDKAWSVNRTTLSRLFRFVFCVL
jgi:hypothetical protein